MSSLISRDTIKSVIYDQQSFYLKDKSVVRDGDLDLGKDNEIVILSGIRRCGKSTLLQQIMHNNKEKDYFLNFDDDRLVKFSVDDFQQLLEVFIEIYGVQHTFYFDEIQNIPDWERFVRRLHDQGNKIYITGSNATMLSKELGTRLTGRHYRYELFPFSFKEFLRLNKVAYSIEDQYNTQGRAILKSNFNTYFLNGGFPAYLRYGNREYLKSLYESILYRDVMVRNKISNEKEILELVMYLASNTSRLVTYNSLKNVIGIQNATTIKNYLEYVQNTYLLFLVNKYDASIKKQTRNPRKTYFIDLALVRMVGFHNSEDNGRLLENLVFLELKRRSKEIYYHKNKKECDFVLKTKTKITEAIQVSWSIVDPNTRKREIDGLLEAMDEHKLKFGLILTDSEEEEIKVDKKNIKIMPVWKWMLQDK